MITRGYALRIFIPDVLSFSGNNQTFKSAQRLKSYYLAKRICLKFRYMMFNYQTNKFVK
jgi:hypothetical protein